jgi:signal transduction histidine kinase
MGKTEIITFIVAANLLLLIFISGILVFVFQYRKRRILYTKEKEEIEKQHHIELLNAQLQSQQETMQFIGQEIHDSVAQKLTLASIYAQQLEFENNNEQLHKKLKPVNKILGDSLLELRQLSKNLTDSKVQHEGFVNLVNQECEMINATGMCTAKTEIEEIAELGIPTKNSLLRIIQEFLQNSLKHSGCKQITVKINMQGRQLMIFMSDDGKGFVPEEVAHNGIGLDNIRRRVQHLGGTHDLYSTPGKGTRLELFIPLNQ